MDENLNLYAVMELYARKIHSPVIEIKKLVFFLEQHAKRLALEQPEWMAWAVNPISKVWEELPRLKEDKFHKIVVNEREFTVLLIDLYEKMIREAYEAEEIEAGPFFSEGRFKIILPDDMVKVVDMAHGLGPYLDDFREKSPAFVKILFSNYGSLLILPELIPRRLPEKAFQKIRNFLRENNNKDYFQNKLIPAFRGKDVHLKEMFNRILTRPGECVDELESAREFSYSFWTYFCTMLITMISGNDELSAADIGLLQSLEILNAFNGYYKIKLSKIKTRDTALKNLSLALEKPPLYFSLDAITKFTDTKGLALLGQYSQDDLEAYLRRETTMAEENHLPELLIIRDMNGVQQFIKKGSLLPCCTQFLSNARPPVRKVIVERWFKMLKALDHEPAMDNDGAFENLVYRTTKTVSPFLLSMLKDHKLYLAYSEMALEDPAPPSGLFTKGKLLPLAALLKLGRKEILADVRILLPFWYSIPILSQIIEQFMRLIRRKNINTDKIAERKADESERFDGNQGSVLKTSVNKTAAVLIPRGKTLDGALAELEDRWGTLQNAKERKNLLEDVNALVRDRLRRTLRLQKSPRITPEALKRLATAIVTGSPTLQNLGGRDALIFYIELYIIKLVQRSEY
ncbi:MAG: hypothetical protein LBU28_01970 [Spirochaetaceae bacterium]|jgi:hypothetical protein|nr:hypothetical protein [Spirochaetaceae bacterium]